MAEVEGKSDEWDEVNAGQVPLPETAVIILLLMCHFFYTVPQNIPENQM